MATTTAILGTWKWLMSSYLILTFLAFYPSITAAGHNWFDAIPLFHTIIWLCAIERMCSIYKVIGSDQTQKLTSDKCKLKVVQYFHVFADHLQPQSAIYRQLSIASLQWSPLIIWLLTSVLDLVMNRMHTNLKPLEQSIISNFLPDPVQPSCVLFPVPCSLCFLKRRLVQRSTAEFARDDDKTHETHFCHKTQILASKCYL